MTTWTRTDSKGITVTFTSDPDERGQHRLTSQELAGLMRDWQEVDQ